MKSFYSYLSEALRIKSGMSNISTKPILSRDPKEKFVIYDNFDEYNDWENAKDENVKSKTVVQKCLISCIILFCYFNRNRFYDVKISLRFKK